MRKYGYARMLFAVLAALSAILVCSSAFAWSGYTHVTLANKAADEIVSTGFVTINNRKYKVRDEVVAAIAAHPDAFQGGTIGPDGFPDLTMGQAVIHPKDTGKWLRLVFARAWQSQGTPEFQRNLAFAYGFLAHGAGDMWGHTLVNKYAGGVFPQYRNIVSDIYDTNKIIHGTNFDGLENAARHMIVEYYVNDAAHLYSINRCSSRRVVTSGEISGPLGQFVVTTMFDRTASFPNAGARGCSRSEEARYAA